MKQIFLNALVATLALSASASADLRMGTVINLKPKAEIFQSGTFKQLKMGTALQSGDRMTTGAYGLIEIMSSDGSALRLGPNSEMTLKALEKGEGSFFELAKGLFQAVVEKQGGRQFKVGGSSGVAAVKGTQFQFEATDKGSELKVIEGSVELSSGAGTATVTVAAGESALSYPDRVDQVKKMNADEVKALKGVFKKLVDEKKKEYSRRVREARGKRSVPNKETK